MTNTIIYNLVESNVLRMFEKLELSKSYEIVDKLELEDELEFTSNNSLLVYSYDVVVSMSIEDDNSSYLVIVVEEDRVLYLLLDNNYKVIKEYIMKDEELNDSMYC